MFKESQKLTNLKNRLSSMKHKLESVCTGFNQELYDLNKMKNKCSIFIISHKADSLVDKFDQSMQFEKKNNFSKIKSQV